jgi:hypothetical protein
LLGGLLVRVGCGLLGTHTFLPSVGVRASRAFYADLSDSLGSLRIALLFLLLGHRSGRLGLSHVL